MPRAALPSGIDLEYTTFGDAADPTILMVNGFGSQMITWPAALVHGLVEQGHHVVTYDNRDVGLSSKLDGQRVAPMRVLRASIAGEPLPEIPYTLSDMAADGIGLLDHLGVDTAHVVGMSMGGMIVQLMAIEHPSRVASLTSVMSSPGDRRYGRPTAEANEALLAPPAADRARFIEDSLRAKTWLSKRHAVDEDIRAKAAAQFDRMFYPEGSTRQLAAIYATPDRSDRLRELSVPTLVIHGRDDTLITPSGGERTAELIPGSVLLLVSDMGHDLPVPLTSLFVDALASHIGRAA